ncbi:MAG: Ig-like domain-containing protein [Bacteroidales bacterium]|nr:Ig-like domain-containing protein [Bacteroidales bacterium]
MKSLKTFLIRVVLTLGILFPMIATAAAPTWTRTNYTSSTAFIGIVKINDYNPSFPITVEEGDYIGAFVGEECRMIAKVFAYDGKLYVSSVIQGGDISDMTGSTSEPEEVEFKVWDNSANKLVSAQVYGTLFTESAGEIFDYEIGKPNTDSKLESLSVTDYTLDPTFSASTTEYQISVPYGTALPASSAYTAVVADSRANATVVAATEFGSDNKATTTITVTAEDNTTTVYTITFVQEACTATAPTSSEVRDVAYCQGNSNIMLDALFGNKSHKAVWYNVQTDGTPLFTGNSFKPGVSDPGQYTYYVARNDGTCESTERTKVTLQIDEKPYPMIVGLDDEYCANAAAVTLGVEQSYVAITFTVNDASATTFDPASAKVGENTIACQVTDIKGCSGSTSQTVTVKALPSIDFSSTPKTVCVGETINLTPTKGTWSGSGVSGTTFSSETAGSVTLTYEELANGCSASDNVTITVNKATAPTVQSASVEMNAAVPALTATADGTINWYETENGAVKGTGTSYTPSVSTAEENVFTFYASNTVAGCESEKVPVTLSVTSCTTEAPAIASVDAICEGDAFPTLTATGTNITWYSAVTGGSSLETGATYTPTAAGTYYASQNPGCEGPRASVTVEVKTKPTTPSVADVSSCGGSSFAAMTANVAANWYTDKNANAVAENVTSYTPTSLSATTKFYVKQVVDGCSSDFAEATYTLVATPDKPKVDATTACFGSTANYIVRMSGNLEANATLQWYDENGTEKGTAKIQDVAVTNAGTYTYTAVQKVGDCASAPASATLTVYALPEPTINVNASFCSDDETEVELIADPEGGDFMVDGIIASSFVPKELGAGEHTILYSYEDEHHCYGEPSKKISVDDCAAPAVETIILEQASLSLLKGEQANAIDVTITPPESPQTVTWSSSDPSVATVDADGNITAVGKGTAIITATSTYTPTKSASCEVTVISPVESVAFNNPSDITVAENGSVSLSQYLVVNPDDASVKTIEWIPSSSVATVTNGVVTVSDVDANTEVTITVKVTTEDGTSKTAQITITIKNGCSLSAPTVANATQSVCPDSGDEVTFTAMGDASANWIWEDATNTVKSTTSSLTTATVGSYFVYQKSGDCESSKTKVTLSEKTKPATPSVSDVAVCEGTTGTFTSSVTAIWYSSANEELTTGKTYSPTTAGTYFVRQQADGCLSDAAMVTYTINPKPEFTTSDQTVVLGATVPNLTVTTASTNIVTWYYNNVEVGTGSSFATNQTAVGTYTYYVTVKTAANCMSEKKAVTLQISDCDLTAPTVANDNQSVCEGGTNPSFTASAANSVVWYSDASLTNQVGTSATYTPTNSVVGTYYYYVTQKSTCESPAKRVTFVINSLPSVSIANIADMKTTDSPVTVSVSPAGGQLSGTGVSGMKFNPAIGAGTHTITYTYQDVNGCMATASTSVVVTKGITVDRTQLGDTIARASNISSLYTVDDSYPASAKNSLSQAIVMAQGYYNNYESYTQAQIDQQVIILSNAIQAFLNSKIEKVDVSILEAKISEAYLTIQTNEYRKGTLVGNIPEASFTMLENAITTASAVVANPPATQAEVVNAVNALQYAITSFLNSEIPNKVSDVSFTTNKIYLVVGEEYTPEVVFAPAGASSDLSWETSNNDVAWVYGLSGKIVAKAPGSVSVTATAANNNAAQARMIVVVTEAPKLESVTVNRTGSEIIMKFSEEMDEPLPDIYTDLYVYGVSYPMYNVNKVSLWDFDTKQIILSVGPVIDDPNEITIVYKGNSLISKFGGKVPQFKYSLGSTPVNEVEAMNVIAYPTEVQSEIHVAGLQEGNQIDIVSATGKRVTSFIAASDVEDISTNSFTAGIYYIMVYDGTILRAKQAFVKK